MNGMHVFISYVCKQATPIYVDNFRLLYNFGKIEQLAVDK